MKKLFYCFIVLLLRWSEPIFINEKIVLLFYCFIVLLFYCFIVEMRTIVEISAIYFLLFYCFIVKLMTDDCARDARDRAIYSDKSRAIIARSPRKL